MTDRRIGQEGANVDIKAGQPRIGQDGVNVDIVPQMVERQTGAAWLTLDYTYPVGVQSGQQGVTVDLATPNQVRTGGLMLMIDYVAALITGGIGWSGTQFVASGGTPVLWGAAAFQTAGPYPPVQWEDGEFST